MGQEHVPAAPLLIAAYGFFVLALLGYLVSISRRMTIVKRDLQRLETRSFVADVETRSARKGG